MPNTIKITTASITIMADGKIKDELACKIKTNCD
jgi:hypothetical protein